MHYMWCLIQSVWYFIQDRKSHWRNFNKHYMWCHILSIWYSIQTRISHWQNFNKHYIWCYPFITLSWAASENFRSACYYRIVRVAISVVSVSPIPIPFPFLYLMLFPLWRSLYISIDINDIYLLMIAWDYSCLG